MRLSGNDRAGGPGRPAHADVCDCPCSLPPMAVLAKEHPCFPSRSSVFAWVGEMFPHMARQGIHQGLEWIL